MEAAIGDTFALRQQGIDAWTASRPPAGRMQAFDANPGLGNLGRGANLLAPATGLDVRAKLRYYETVNSSSYLSCNPLTGQIQSVPRHQETPNNLARKICRGLSIPDP